MKLTFQDNKPVRVTEGRLHFSETTLNNMRKKGKPNPEQKYFQLVVSLEAVVSVNGAVVEVPVCCLATEKIIVRASNPGLFEPEQEVSWSKNSGKGLAITFIIRLHILSFDKIFKLPDESDVIMQISAGRVAGRG